MGIKIVKITTIITFIAILLMPSLFFNWKKDYVSEIDNRKLTEFPNDQVSSGDLTKDIENFLNDRIGFRNQIIRTYTKINDKVFGVMEHPTYTYGKNGYVFFKMHRAIKYNDFHKEFVSMVGKIQRYCDERDVPFVFCFNPAKMSALSQHLPPGVNYDSSWVNEMISALRAEGVNVVDNSEYLKTLAETEYVFNKKFDAGHWNDLGAFYGMNKILSSLNAELPSVDVNKVEDFEFRIKIETSLPVSEFEIYDETPEFISKINYENKTESYNGEVLLNQNFPTFYDLVIPSNVEKGLPKAMVFQGSYVNGKGNKFLTEQLGEYIAIHNYQNILNFEYYYNIFKPDCVIFEVAEYTIINNYFNLELMKEIQLNPSLENYKNLPKRDFLSSVSAQVREGEMLADILVTGLPDTTKYAYLCLDGEEFDLKYQESGTYTLSLKKDLLRKKDAEIRFIDDSEREQWKCLQLDIENVGEFEP